MRRAIMPAIVGLLALLALGPQQRAGAANPLAFLYVHDSGTPTRVFAFQMDSAGQLQPVVGSPFSTGAPGHQCAGQCETIAFSATKKLLFITGETGISVFHVAGDGALTLVPGSPFGTGELLGVTVLAQGASTYVYAAEFDNNRVRGFQVQADGSLVELPTSPFATGNGPDGISSVKNLVFVANDTARSISTFKLGPGGSLSPPQTVRLPYTVTPPFIYNLNAEPLGKFVYAAQANTSIFPDVLAFKIKFSASSRSPKAKLVLVKGGVFGTQIQNTGGGLALGQTLLFAIGFNAGGTSDVQAMRRSANGSLVNLGSGQDSGLPALAAGALAPTGGFLALVEQSAGHLKTFGVSSSSGVITLAATVPIDLAFGSGILFVQP